MIAATNQDLEAAIDERRFRPDLYYRLSVFPIKVPALRERQEDVEVLARHFVKVFATKLRKPVTDIEPAALARLRDYSWPGNVRELQNLIERAVILSAGPAIESGTITLPQRTAVFSQVSVAPPAGTLSPGAHDTHEARDGRGAVMSLADAERQAIQRALNAAHWRISGPGGAAEMLGLRPTTLHAKMKKLAIRRPG